MLEMRHLVSFFMPSRSLSHILRDGVARPVSRLDACPAASPVILSEAKNLSAASVIPDLIGNLAPVISSERSAVSSVISSERSESRNLLFGNQSIKSINL